MVLTTKSWVKLIRFTCNYFVARKSSKVADSESTRGNLSDIFLILHMTTIKASRGDIRVDISKGEVSALNLPCVDVFSSVTLSRYINK